MSNDETTTEEPEEPTDQTAPLQRCDNFLQVLTHVTNGVDRRGNGFVSVTLQVGGLLVSGTLASGRGFFKAQKEGMIAAWRRSIEGNNQTSNKADPMVGALEELFGRFESNYPGQGEEDKDNHQALPEFIHLKNAKIWMENGRPISADAGLWWRGRLAAVDAFWLGTLDPE